MQTVMHPFAHKDAVENISYMFIAGANFSRKVWDEKLFGTQYRSQYRSERERPV